MCVCVWFRFAGWEQFGTRALSSHQVQEINVYYLEKKRNKITTSPLICSISWCLLWLRAPLPERPLTSAVPGGDAAPWSNPSGLHYLLMSWHSKQWCKQCELWGSFSFSIPLGMPLSLPRPSAFPESPKHLASSAALFKKSPSLPIAWNPWNRKEWIAGWHMPWDKTAACE